jgi:hypothetical protein
VIASKSKQGLSYIVPVLEMDPTINLAKQAIRWLMKRMPSKSDGKRVQDLRIPDEMKNQTMP